MELTKRDTSDDGESGGVILPSRCSSNSLSPSAAVEPGHCPINDDSKSDSSNNHSVGIILQDNGHKSPAASDVMQQRQILVCTLRLLRSELVRIDPTSSSIQWLDSTFPIDGGISYEQDVLIPNIVYTITYSVRDCDFVMLEDLMAQCPLALGIQKMLSVGRAQFDQVNESMET